MAKPKEIITTLKTFTETVLIESCAVLFLKILSTNLLAYFAKITNRMMTIMAIKKLGRFITMESAQL